MNRITHDLHPKPISADTFFDETSTCTANIPNVARASATLPLIDGLGSDEAWAFGVPVPLFKDFDSSAEVMGYASVFYDCMKQSWYIKVEHFARLAAGNCSPDEDCNHYVKVDGNRVANPHDDGAYLTDNSGFELSFPSGKAPAAGTPFHLEIISSVYDGQKSHSSGTVNVDQCNQILASCEGF